MRTILNLKGLLAWFQSVTEPDPTVGDLAVAGVAVTAAAIFIVIMTIQLGTYYLVSLNLL